MARYNAKEGVIKEKPEAKDSKKWLYIWLAVSIVLLFSSMYVAHKHKLTGLQARIFYDFNNPDLGSGFTTLAKWITEGLGSAYPIIVCVLVPLIFKKYRLAWRVVVTVGGALVLAEIIKKIVNEPRPIVMLKGQLHQRVIETGPGFPSGHETAATAMALTLWFVLPPKWRWVSILWIVVVAWSRLYLGVHTPADIIGGFSAGLLAVCIVCLLPKSISKPLRLDSDS